DANVLEFMDMVQTWTDDTLIVGHLPFMPRLISGLVMGNPDVYPIVNYPPAGIVCLQHFDQHRWIIQWILNPFLVSEQSNNA
ncbi:MAG: phosphohistidine phosphatase SixA, partial [Coxiellaceae bacterium]|nr:phosphohistidine phosphatase SixA [Coxiellaceae bacterium]